MLTLARPIPSPPLFRYLLLAAFLHGLVLFCLKTKLRPEFIPFQAPTLQLHLSPPANPPPLQQPAPAEPIARARPAERASPTTEHAGSPAAERADTASRAPEAQSPPISADMLIESARRRLQEESRQRTSAPFALPPEAAREAPAGSLARAMARRPAGEKLLAGGIVQATTADGKVFCLKQPPLKADGGLSEGLAVPTNCP